MRINTNYYIVFIVFLMLIPSVADSNSSPQLLKNELEEIKRHIDNIEIGKDDNKIMLDHLSRQLKTIEKKWELLELNYCNDKEILNQDKSNIFLTIRWLSTGILSTTALIFGIGSLLIFKQNQNVIKSAQNHFMLIDKQKEIFEMGFNNLIIESKYKYQADIKELKRKFNVQLYNLQYFHELSIIIKNTPKAKMDDQCKHDVFSLLTPLVSAPKKEYSPLFNRIVKLKIKPEITKKASDGLEKIKNNNE